MSNDRWYNQSKRADYIFLLGKELYTRIDPKVLHYPYNPWVLATFQSGPFKVLGVSKSRSPCLGDANKILSPYLNSLKICRDVGGAEILDHPVNSISSVV